VGVARGRSYASVLLIPRRKTSLCEALHGRRPWPDLKIHESSWGAHWRGEGEGGEGGEQWGAAGGGAVGGLGLGLRATVHELLPVCYPSVVRAVACCA
jgi:hypothetical protein